MIVKRQDILIILKLMVFFLTTAGLVYVFVGGLNIVFVLLLGILVIAEAFDLVHFYNAQNRKLTYFFEAIRNEDTTLFFPENVRDKSLNALHKSLNALNRMISDIKIKNETNERFYRELIEHSSTGLMSLDKEGYIEIMNSTAKKYLGVVQLSNISLLQQKNSLLYDAITELRPGEKKTIKTMVGRELLSLSIQSSELCFSEKSFKLISLQDIGHELEENEIDSWQKLIRVMTHEIMNSIAPITSLTNTLLSFYHTDGVPKKPEELSQPVVSNTIEGLTVIEGRGKGLIHFVDNYRKLAHVPQPVFAPLDVKSWVHGLGLLFRPEFQNRDIDFSFAVDSSLSTILTDEKILNQVMINLITNSIEALSSYRGMAVVKKIKLTVHGTPTGSVQIELSDNGCGIDSTVMDKIFIPFFTTKEGGNGIGLSLSRQLIRKLNGKISVHSKVGQGSCFVVDI